MIDTDSHHHSSHFHKILHIVHSIKMGVDSTHNMNCNYLLIPNMFYNLSHNEHRLCLPSHNFMHKLYMHCYRKELCILNTNCHNSNIDPNRWNKPCFINKLSDILKRLLLYKSQYLNKILGTLGKNYQRSIESHTQLVWNLIVDMRDSIDSDSNKKFGKCWSYRNNCYNCQLLTESMKSTDFRNNRANLFCQLFLNMVDIFVDFYQNIISVSNTLENKSFYESYQYITYNHSIHPNKILWDNRLEIKEELPTHYKGQLLIQMEMCYLALSNCCLLHISYQELHILYKYPDRPFAECYNKAQMHSRLTSRDWWIFFHINWLCNFWNIDLLSTIHNNIDC